jgi:hypothetical protein
VDQDQMGSPHAVCFLPSDGRAAVRSTTQPEGKAPVRCSQTSSFCRNFGPYKPLLLYFHGTNSAAPI